MLPHKTGKLAVFSVELQNADPVLDFLRKQVASGCVIYKHILYTAIWTVYIIFKSKEQGYSQT